MADPSELLGVARLLLAQSPASDAQLRRAVSTAYYALFHTVLRAAAQRFMGPGQEQSGGYTVLYRSFDHQHMKRVCESLRSPTLGAKLRFNLGKSSVSQDIGEFAATFAGLQDARHRADYHPTYVFRPSQVVALIDSAEVAMAAFDRAAADERADVLALMMVRIRD